MNKTTDDRAESANVDPWGRIFDDAGPAPTLDEYSRGRLESDLRGRFRDLYGPRRARRGLHWWWLAASVVAALGLWLVFGSRPQELGRVEAVGSANSVLLGGEPLEVGASIREGDRLTVSGEGRVALAVGGVSMRVAPGEGAAADFAVLSRDRHRLVSGKLYFDRIDRGAPVVVETPWGEVRDVGTQYLIELRDGLRVRVREGSVELRTDGREFEVRQGYLRFLGQDGETYEETAAAADVAWDWVLDASPPFDLDGVTVAEFLTWVGRETGHRVEYAGDGWQRAAEGEVLHGSPEGLRADLALGAVMPSTGWPYDVGEGRILIGTSEAPGPAE